MASTTNQTGLEAALAAMDKAFLRPAPVAKSTPEQLAFARLEAFAVVTHDGLRPGERMVAGRVYVFNADALNAHLSRVSA